MNSKQALENLYQGALNPVNCVYSTFRTGASNKITDDYNIIKKDLEVLELVKKYFELGCAFDNSKKSIHINERQHNHNTIYGINISNEEYNLIEEWLENDK